MHIRKTGTMVLAIGLIIIRFSECFPTAYGLPGVAAPAKKGPQPSMRRLVKKRLTWRSLVFDPEACHASIRTL